MAAQHGGRDGGVHLTSNPIDWYAARAGGVVAYVLLSSVVALGLSMTSKKSMKRWPRFALEDVHRFGGLLVGTFVAIHVAAVAIDAYLPFSPASLVIPLTARYRPIWTGLGIVAAELLIALAVTNHYRNSRISYRVWRSAHYVNFAVWIAATLHGLGTGTDRSTVWLVAIYAVAVASVCGLIIWRVLSVRGARGWLPHVSSLVGAGTAVVLVAALALGPLRFKPKPWNAASFRERLTGQIVTDTGVTRGIVSMAGNGSGSQLVLVRADLLIAPGRLVSTDFQMEYLPSGTICLGNVTAVHNFGFEAACRLPNGTRRFVHAEWRPGNGRRLVGGMITSHA
jgi:methionine sulfoxide reductase heme-binding subunit